MRIWSLILSGFLLLSSLAHLRAGERAEIAAKKLVSTDAPSAKGSDLVRFADQWFAAQLEDFPPRVRVLASKDGEKWESVALLKSTTPERGLGSPFFSVTPNGQLIVSAVGVVPHPSSGGKVPQYGGTINTMAWFSADGRAWGEAKHVGQFDYLFGRIAWDKGMAYTYGSGCICGIMQTVQLFSSRDATKFEGCFEQTFSGFFPEEGSVSLHDGKGTCLMSRGNGAVADTGRIGAFLGTAKAPYREWEWKPLDARIKHPNLLRLADGRLVASLSLLDGKPRNALCEIDAATGKLTELVTLPTNSKLAHVGLAAHGEHLWASVHLEERGAPRLHLVKVKLAAP